MMQTSSALKGRNKRFLITACIVLGLTTSGFTIGCESSDDDDSDDSGSTSSSNIEALIEAGGTIPAGTYKISRKISISKSGLTINATGVTIDASKLSSNSGSGDGITISGSNNKLIGISVTKAGHNGICITGKGNTVQDCQTYGNGNTGLNLKGGAGNNTIIGCVSFDNYDEDKGGEDADGFGVKAGSASGNKFIDCEAYNNSDDGWDFWDNQYGVTLQNCYAHNNGRGSAGDGNGFKLGNSNTSANHYLKDCKATNNRGSGFTQNGNTGKNTYVNCTSSGNGKADKR